MVAVMSYCRTITRRYGRCVSPDCLMEATRHPQPKPGKVTDQLFLSWGRLTDRLARPDFRVVTFAIGHGDCDFAFAHWLLHGQKDQVLARLRPMADIDRVRGFRKLRQMAAFGRQTHAQLAAGQFFASSIAKQMSRALASGRVSIDPDEARQGSAG